MTTMIFNKKGGYFFCFITQEIYVRNNFFLIIGPVELKQRWNLIKQEEGEVYLFTTRERNKE